MKPTCLLFASVSILVTTVFSGCQELRSVKNTLPDVSEACAVLQNFRGEYSYGGWGLAAESNDGELAVWTIYHSSDATQRLLRAFQHCGPSGQAYALAALYRLDRRAFQSLTNTFCQERGDIHAASGCIGVTETRAELLAQMQRPNSTLAFYPSRPPRRRAMTFRGDRRDVYEEASRLEQMRAAEAARGLAALQQAELSVFTNLFRVEQATDLGDSSISGVYFSGPEWSANLFPKELLPCEVMVEVVFPKSNNVFQVGITPGDLMKALKAVSSAPFLRILDRESGVTDVRLRAAGDRLHWDTDEVILIERALKTGVPLNHWAQVIIDVGSQPRREYIEMYHPVETDIYVVTGGFKVCADWRKQYRKLTGQLPSNFPHVRFPKGANNPHYPVVNGAGEVRLVPGTEAR